MKHVLAVLLFASVCSMAAPLPLDSGKLEGNLRFYDLHLLGLEGKGWTNTPGAYDRLPTTAEGKVPKPVWNLSRQSAGLCARFETKATELSVRWKLTSSKLDMVHMPATGVSGVDLYVRQPDGKWRWVAVGFPRGQENTLKLFSGVSSESREFCLYLPLYNGVSSVELGVPKETTIEPGRPRSKEKQKPLLFYGTSITQGGCASRPGMVHTSIIGRALDRPVINLGFSGSGRMESVMADLLAEQDPAVFILDCLPNMNGKMVKGRLQPFVEKLRKARPDTPILLVEDRNYTDGFFKTARARTNEENQRELKASFERLKVAGVKRLYYLEGDGLLGEDGEGAVDGSHPTDLGFARQAEAFMVPLREILEGK